MDKTLQFIAENEKWQVLGDYISRIKYFSGEPGVVLENCKSLIESVFKTIITEMHGKREEDLISYKMGALNREVIALLHLQQSEYSNIIKSATVTINRLRNKLGMTAHGRSVATLAENRRRLADYEIESLILMTDHVVFFLLSYYKNRYPHSALSRGDSDYRDNGEFNAWFDASEPPLRIREIEVPPSRVLFDYDAEAYKEYAQAYCETNYLLRQLAASAALSEAGRLVAALQGTAGFSPPQLRRLAQALTDNEHARLATRHGAARRFIETTLLTRGDLFSDDELARLLAYY